MIKSAKYYKLFFKGVDFMLVDYYNGLAEFTSDLIVDEEEGETSLYKVIISVHDNCLKGIDEDFNSGDEITYSIEDIFDRSEKVNEITQHELIAFKVDTLFNNTTTDEEEIQRD